MTISFDNYVNMVKKQTEELRKTTPNESGLPGCWLDQEVFANAVMQRTLLNAERPKETQGSGYKGVRNTAVVTLHPMNEELHQKLSAYFLSEKLPAFMGKPECLFYDVVVINDRTIIG